MKVVLDTNVLVSYLLTRSDTTSKILEAWIHKKYTLLINEEILTEIQQVLSRFVYQGLIEAEEASSLINIIKSRAEFVPTLSSVSLSKDKKDNRYLSCAKDAAADYLVTGDKKHLLPLKKIGKTKIISPREFINLH